MINPFIRIGFVNCYDPHHRRVTKGYLKVQRPSTGREPKQQRARRVFVLGIIFDNLGVSARLANFLFADIPFHHTSEGMTTELELPSSELTLNIQQGFHFAAPSLVWISLGIRPQISYGSWSVPGSNVLVARFMNVAYLS
jgi:hypothetical protein